MTSKTITFTALASMLAFAAGCSSVREQPASTYGSVGAVPTASSSSNYEFLQYGTVSDIHQLDASQRKAGAGALIGAVVGGVLGNQVGSGTGRTAATAIGAVGGAVAGNEIEKRSANPQTYYQINVRLDNGDMRSFDYQDLNGLRVGDRVRIENGQLQRW